MRNFLLCCLRKRLPASIKNGDAGSKLPHGGSGGKGHETSGISQNRGRRACRVHHCCRAGHRAVDAGAEMALHDELAEIARCPVQRVGNDFEICCGSNRQQISDSKLRRGRNRSCLAGGRCSGKWHRRDVSHGCLLLHRQGSDLRALLLDTFRAEFAPAECLVPGSRRPGHAQ